MSVRPEDLSQFLKGRRAHSRAGNSRDLWRLGRPDQAQAVSGAVSSLPGQALTAEVCHCRRGAPPAGRRVRGRHARGHRGIRRRGRVRYRTRQLCQPHQLFPTQLRRSIALRKSEDRTRPHRRKRRESVPTACSTSPPRRSSLPASWKTWARRAWRSPRRAALSWSSKSPSATTSIRRASSITRSTPCSRKARSSASTTTWARRRCRICWSSASPTASSSPSGNATTSTTCRLPWPKPWAWRAAGRFTRRPERCAMWSRTT